MGVNRIAAPIDIAISGLRAESLRMKVIADNIANAKTTRTASGEPYRRQQLVLSTKGTLSGVRIDGVAADTDGEFKDVYMPGHPHARGDGMVQMPNIDLPVEMMNLVVASRAYQANAAILKRHQTMVDAALELLR